jgi:hypothetical protein
MEYSGMHLNFTQHCRRRKLKNKKNRFTCKNGRLILKGFKGINFDVVIKLNWLKIEY